MLRSAALTLLSIGLGGGLAYLAVGPAWPHEAIPTASQPLGWVYGSECCSAYDCSQVQHGEIVPTPEGWRVNASGETIPYGDARVKRSKDEFFHRCAPAGDMTSKRSICIYVPDFGG